MKRTTTSEQYETRAIASAPCSTLTPLLNYLVHVIEHTFRAESVAVYLRAPSEHAFMRALPKPPSSPDPPLRALSHISDTSPLAQLLNARRETVVREEAIRHTHDPPT